MRAQDARGVGDEPFVDFKARRPGEERDVRLVVADFALEAGFVRSRNIGRIRNEDVDAVVAKGVQQDRRAMKSTCAESRRALARATPNAAAEISVAKTRARVSSARVIAIAPEPVPTSTTTSPRLNASDGRFHQVLGLRARDQDVRRHAEIAAVKFLAAR